VHHLVDPLGLGEVAQAYVPPSRALRSRLVDVV
jgi:hypothetical protein